MGRRLLQPFDKLKSAANHQDLWAVTLVFSNYDFCQFRVDFSGLAAMPQHFRSMKTVHYIEWNSSKPSLYLTTQIFIATRC